MAQGSGSQIYLGEVLISDFHPKTRVQPVQSIVAVIAGLCNHILRPSWIVHFFFHIHYLVRLLKTVPSYRILRAVIPLIFSKFINASSRSCGQCALKLVLKLRPMDTLRV